MRGRDILETALYGGITYWATPEGTQRDAEGLPTQTTLTSDEGDFEPLTVRCGDLVPAARAVLAAYPKTQGAGYIRQALAENDPGMIDAEAADMIVQVAVFGEIIYG